MDLSQEKPYFRLVNSCLVIYPEPGYHLLSEQPEMIRSEAPVWSGACSRTRVQVVETVDGLDPTGWFIKKTGAPYGGCHKWVALKMAGLWGKIPSRNRCKLGGTPICWTPMDCAMRPPGSGMNRTWSAAGCEQGIGKQVFWKWGIGKANMAIWVRKTHDTAWYSIKFVVLHLIFRQTQMSHFGNLKSVAKTACSWSWFPCRVNVI